MGQMDEESEAGELRRYEAERRERSRRLDRAGRRIVGWVVAAALAVLAYASATEAQAARREDRPWAYPAVLAVVCAGALLALLVLFLILFLVRASSLPARRSSVPRMPPDTAAGSDADPDRRGRS